MPVEEDTGTDAKRERQPRRHETGPTSAIVLRHSRCGDDRRGQRQGANQARLCAIYIGVTGDAPHKSQREAYKVDSTMRCDDATPT